MRGTVAGCIVCVRLVKLAFAVSSSPSINQGSSNGKTQTGVIISGSGELLGCSLHLRVKILNS